MFVLTVKTNIMRSITIILFALVANFSFGQFQSFKPLHEINIKYMGDQNDKNVINDDLTPYSSLLQLKHYRELVKESKDKIRSYYKKDTSEKNPTFNGDILKFEDQLNKYSKIRDTVYNYYIFKGKKKLFAGFVPFRSTAAIDYFYDNDTTRKMKFLESISLHAAPDKSIVATEVFNGYWWLLRFNISSTFYNGDEDTTQTQVDKINNGGGLFSANINYPIYYRTGTNGVFSIDINTRGSADINAFGTEIPKSEFVGYFEPSVNPYAEFKFRNTNTRLVFQYKYAWVFPTKTLNSIIRSNQNSYYHVSLFQVGFNFANNLKLTANIPIKVNRGISDSENFTVGIQYFPRSKKTK